MAYAEQGWAMSKEFACPQGMAFVLSYEIHMAPKIFLCSCLYSFTMSGLMQLDIIS